MTKNWIGFRTGHFDGAGNWLEDGFVRFDPAAVISVRAGNFRPDVCTIYFTSGYAVVDADIDTVISQIQSAL